MLKIRYSRTGSGAIAIQIGHAHAQKWTITKHIGSAHDDITLNILWNQALEYLEQHQPTLALPPEYQPTPPTGLFPPATPTTHDTLFDTPPHDTNPPAPNTETPWLPGDVTLQRSASTLLWDALDHIYTTLGFHHLKDKAFRQMVLARVVESTSKRDVPRVVEQLGQKPVSLSTLMRHLAKQMTRTTETNSQRGVSITP